MGNGYGQEEYDRKYCWRCKVCGYKSPLTAQTCENPACGANLSMYGEYMRSDLTPEEEEALLKQEEEKRNREMRNRKFAEERLRREEEEKKAAEEAWRRQQAAKEEEERTARERARQEEEWRKRAAEEEELRRRWETERQREEARQAEETEQQEARRREEARRAEYVRQQEAVGQTENEGQRGKNSQEELSSQQRKKKEKGSAGRIATVFAVLAAVVIIFLILNFTVSAIEVKKSPDKMSYEVGESFDAGGMRLNVTYYTGRNETIFASLTDDISFSPASFTRVGTQTVTITYGGKSTEIDVSVAAADSTAGDETGSDTPEDDSDTSEDNQNTTTREEADSDTTLTASESNVTMEFYDTAITSFELSPTTLTSDDQLVQTLVWNVYCEPISISFTSDSSTDASVTVTSSDTSIVQVAEQTQNGSVTTVKLAAVYEDYELTGANNTHTRSATVTATANDGSGASCSVSVTVTEPFSYTITSNYKSVFHFDDSDYSSWTIEQSGMVILTVESSNGNRATAMLYVVAD